MPHLGLKSTFAIKLAFLAKKWHKLTTIWGFLDQINGLKKGLKIFLTSSWQILAIMTAHNVMKMPFKCQNDFLKEEIKEDIMLNRIEKIKSKWIL